MTQLHAGGKFDHDSYKVSGGLHGVGVSVVNALSERLELTIDRDGKKHFIEFKNGDAKSPLKVVGKSKNTGTEIKFLPSKEIFSLNKFSFLTLQKRKRELAFKNALLAAATARSTSSSLPATTKPISSSVAGFINAIFSVPFGVTNSPLI